MMASLTELRQSIRDRSTLLFVGAGVSKTLGLPVFRELVDKMARDLGYDPDVFQVLGVCDFLTIS